MFRASKPSNASVEYARAAIKFIVLALFLAACTPTFNWREVSFDEWPITALLPCKPDRGTRMVPLAGSPRAMTMAGCEAGGAMFTVAVVDMGDVTQVAAATAQLRAASKATYSHYAQHGHLLVQAAVYGNPKTGQDGPGALSAQAVETFLTGLKLPAKL